ncbi:SH3 domain-containing kinase-binding protein 1 isoform X5 [Lingula anatina]|uniref:SH3 domain-containing kinase-binding protein 1 isoform X4 n=1 Tax=Lingula anatina TaxID=7574 RepID=A0A1S3KFR8_LINAN|nr:SH3 domain-containing kinase-binding protein 1 isoform X4 [Lingula anatina]XP_013421486.1 SH3 domain-containing kinase-binding protein 1 isoform X5 [Lingula anatina]|eukprot:XP_013421485.1 SH3 domain-containing kinase-binding protein 1 isoform X4 [Lingula anatina]
MECIVEFEYTAEQDDELTLKVGEVITNVVKQEGGWWEGELSGKKGMFPDNFVKEVVKHKEPQKEPMKEHIKSESHKEVEKKKDESHGKGHHIAALKDRLGDHAIHAGAPQPKAFAEMRRKSTNNRKLRAKATFSYTPENDDELKLEAGDIVEVLKEEEEGWWQGTVNGKNGVFPSNFVELLDGGKIEDLKAVADHEDEKSSESANDTTAMSEDKPAEEPPPEITGKKVKGVGLGNIFSGGPIKLRSTGALGKKPAELPKEPAKEIPMEPLKEHHAVSKKNSHNDDHRSSIRNKAPPPVPHERPPSLPPRDVKPIERARVLYSYSAENDDELNLAEGDVITILDKELEDGGWWKGELDGKIGVFPDNFVELLPPEEVLSQPKVAARNAEPHSAPKPRKPPPPMPAVPAVPAPQTKPLKEVNQHHHHHIKPPEKPPPPEVTKPETKFKKADNEKPAPALPAKKPLPPPIGKKPVPAKPTDLPKPKPVETKVNEGKDTVDSKTSVNNKPDVNHLDTIETTETLSHLTVNRPKNASKRPPSSAILHKDTELVEPLEPSWVKEVKRASIRDTSDGTTHVQHESHRKLHHHHKEPEKFPEKALPHVKRPPPPTVKHQDEEKEKEVTSPRSSTDDAKLIQELRQEMKEMKESTVSIEKYNDLKKDLNELKAQFMEFRNTSNKRILDLMNEVDEEKKIRLNTQVEIERIKKLVT